MTRDRKRKGGEGCEEGSYQILFYNLTNTNEYDDDDERQQQQIKFFLDSRLSISKLKKNNEQQ